METKHIFVVALDVNELLPFAFKKTKTLQESLKEQDRAKKELVRFIDKLQSNWKEKVYYMGMDVIGEKAYERFIFEKGGFFEIMVEAPVAINAHFVHEKRAKIFLLTIKKTLNQILKKSPVTEMFIESIELRDENDTSLSVDKWHKLKNIRDL